MKIDTLTATKWSFLVLGLATLLFGLWWGYRRRNALTNWPKANAVVTKSEIVNTTLEDGPAYSNAVWFRYDIAGTAHEVRVNEWGTTTSASRHQRIAGQYSVGTQHEILYNPAKPDDILVGAGYTVEYFKVTLFCLLLGGIFAGVGALLFLLPRRP